MNSNLPPLPLFNPSQVSDHLLSGLHHSTVTGLPISSSRILPGLLLDKGIRPPTRLARASLYPKEQQWAMCVCVCVCHPDQDSSVRAPLIFMCHRSLTCGIRVRVLVLAGSADRLAELKGKGRPDVVLEASSASQCASLLTHGAQRATELVACMAQRHVGLLVSAEPISDELTHACSTKGIAVVQVFQLEETQCRWL